MKSVLLFLTALCFLINASYASGLPKREVKRGNLLYNEKKFDEALKEYESAFLGAPDSDIVNFNLGAALYKTKDYKAAISHFEKGFVSSDRVLEEKANYNTGNAEYKYGITQEDVNLEGAIKYLEKALGHYERAISIDPEDEDAKYNYEFVKKELERMKKKKEEEKKQEKEDQKDDKDQKDEQDKDNQESDQNKENKDNDKQDDKEQDQQDKQDKESQQDKQENEQNKNQKDQQDEQDREDKKDQQDKNNQEPNQNQREQSPSGGQSPSESKQDEMSEEEAKMLPGNYQDNEEPKGLFKENIPAVAGGEDYKDW